MSVKTFEEQVDYIVFRLLSDAVRDVKKARQLTEDLLPDHIIPKAKKLQESVQRELTVGELASVLGDALLDFVPPREQYSVVRVELDPDGITPYQTYLCPQLYKTKKDAMDDVYNQLECQYGPGLQGIKVKTDDIGDYDLAVLEHFQEDNSWRTMTRFRIVKMKG